MSDSSFDPIALLFGGLAQLGPGDDTSTLRALTLLPRKNFSLVVDAGCGSGRQTFVLAKALGAVIHAVDLQEPFLNDLTRRAQDAGLEHLVRTYCMDMQEIPRTFQEIDLLWAEGSAYNIGFQNALTCWRNAISPGGFLVVSELAWLTDLPPEEVTDYFRADYPDMQSLQRNLEGCEEAGYEVLHTFTLPRESWTHGYYDVLKPRAEALQEHEDISVRNFAREMRREIEIFTISQDSYGYVFFLLQRH